MTDLPDDLKPMSEESVRGIAAKCGENSASARILVEYERMKANGSNPVIGYSPKHNVFVCQDIGRC